MNYDSIKKRLAAISDILTPGDMVVTVEIDGTRKKIQAAEWWEHRQEWKLADFDYQDNSGGLVLFLVLAALADDSLQQAEPGEAERLIKEREDMLSLYFGGKDQ